MALRAALCCVLALKATAEGPAGVADDIFAAVRRDDAAAIERLYNADKSILDKTGPGGQSPTMHGVLQGKAPELLFGLQELISTIVLVEAWRLAFYAIRRTDDALNSFALAVVGEDEEEDDF